MSTNRVFTCDNCGQPIEQTSDGWVEWVSKLGPGGKRTSTGLRIVHHRSVNPSCARTPEQAEKMGGGLSDHHLDHFLDPKNWRSIARRIGEGQTFPAVLLLMRLYVPGFEEDLEENQVALVDECVFGASARRDPEE